VGVFLMRESKILDSDFLGTNIVFRQAEVEAVAGLSAASNNALREVSATADTAKEAADTAGHLSLHLSQDTIQMGFGFLHH